jgi:hypothetical protein
LIPEGQRNEVLWSLAKTMFRGGRGAEEIEVALLEENKRCTDSSGRLCPLDAEEIRRIIQSARQYVGRQRTEAQNHASMRFSATAAARTSGLADLAKQPTDDDLRPALQRYEQICRKGARDPQDWEAAERELVRALTQKGVPAPARTAKKSIAVSKSGRSQGADPNDRPVQPATNNRPIITTNNRPLRDVTDDALRALDAINHPPVVFVKHATLVRVCRDEKWHPFIQELNEAALRGELARAADWIRRSQKGDIDIPPPKPVVENVLATPHLHGKGFPALEGITEIPVLRPDGTVVTKPGYDPETRLCYAPDKTLKVSNIPTDPTKEDLDAACSLMEDTFGQFPFRDPDIDYANLLGLVLTPPLRQVLEAECVPLAIIDSPKMGTGKTLLARAATEILAGRGLGTLEISATSNDEEWRKQITAAMERGATIINIDNVDGSLQAPSLSRALTSTLWHDRILGRSKMGTWPQRATWIATGNNIKLRRDLIRRSYCIRLDAKTAKPWQRTGFRHPDLLGWIRENRGSLVAAALTLCRGWFSANKPPAVDLPSIGGFDAWARTVGGVLSNAGVPGFLNNLEELYESSAEEEREWEAFLSVLQVRYSPRGFTAQELVARLLGSDDPELTSLLPGTLAEKARNDGFSRSLGRALARKEDTPFGDRNLRLARCVTADSQTRSIRWAIAEGWDEESPG